MEYGKKNWVFCDGDLPPKGAKRPSLSTPWSALSLNVIKG